MARPGAAAGRELHKRIATFLEPYAKLGRQLNSAVNAYNQGAGSLDARVMPQLRRLEEAGAGSEKPVPPLAGLDTPVKLIVAAELAEAREADTADPSSRGCLDRGSLGASGSARVVQTFLGGPSLSTSGETLTIEESVTLRARTENAGHVGDEHEWSPGCG